jgi:ferritin-like metal-binding protein YciE
MNLLLHRQAHLSCNSITKGNQCAAGAELGIIFADWSPGKNMVTKRSIKDLLSDEIKDLYSAERQLTKAIPKMVQGSNDASLKAAFTAHLAETQEQVSRLEQAAGLLGIRPTGKKCVGMEGCIGEGAEALEEDGNKAVLDLGLIGAGARVEHYEIAGYITAINLSQRLGASAVVSLLKQSLAEEEAANKKLRQIGATLLNSAPIEA